MINSIGAWMGYAFNLKLLTGIHLEARNMEKGLAALEEAFAIIERLGSWMDEPE